MAAGLLIVPAYMPAEDINGDRIAGARLYVYDDGTTDLATIYTDNTQTSTLANPVIADDVGAFSLIWAELTDLFTVSATDAEGAPLPNGTFSGIGPAIDATLASVALAATAQAAAEAALATVLASPGTKALSTTNLAIGTGPKVFTLTVTGKALAEGQRVVSASDANALNQMSGIITGFADPVLTVEMDATAGSGSHADWIISLTGDGAVSSVAGLTGPITATPLKTALSLENVNNVAVLGPHALWIPASAMLPRTTNGAASGSVELATNKIMVRTLDFDASTIEYAQFALRMPKSWDEGTITAVFEWSHAATVTNFKVSWGLQALALSDDDAMDAAPGTAIYSNDTGGTTNDAYASPATAAITVGGTPAAEDLVVFQVLRKADDATNDTLTIDARLHGVTLFITTNAGTDA